ncbi:unnamed protein product [Peniophora sp. CBMAI 1063]|nr:unnamed protein product [Peniophora sp. CBMAI 1063]
MFSSTRLHAFVCIALGVAASAAPAGGLGANVESRSPDTYDLSGNGGLVGGYYDPYTGYYYPDGYPYGGNRGDSDEDVYILKRQVPGDLDIGSKLETNMGVQHAVPLGEAALGLTSAVDAGADVEKRSPDVYDLSGDGGVPLFFGGHPYGGYPYGGQGDGDSDVYILKREVDSLGLDSQLGANMNLGQISDLFASALDPSVLNSDLGLSTEDSAEKRQFGLGSSAGLGLGSSAGLSGLSGLSDLSGGSFFDSNTGTTTSTSTSGSTSTSTSTSTDTTTDGSGLTGLGSGTSGLDVNSLLSSFGGSAGANGGLTSGLGLGI